MPRNTGTNIYTIPPDTEGIPDQTIESATYNIYLHDVEKDLNDPRPIIAGGTGANDADEALANLGAEKAAQIVTNYDTHVWIPGSFRSAGSATAGPVDGHAFAGIVYLNENYLTPPTNANVLVSARDMNDTFVPGRVYVREKKANLWGPWSVDPSMTQIIAEYAPINSPLFTGDARAPTPLVNDNDTTIATTAFVSQAVANSFAAGGGSVDALAYSGMQINGAFDINQEGTASRGTSGYICDGWMLTKTGGSGVVAFSQQPQPGIDPHAISSMLVGSVSTIQATLGTTDVVSVSTRIEGLRIVRLGWGGTGAQPITIGFWSGHAPAGIYSVSVRNSLQNRSYTASYQQATANVLQYNVVTLPGETNGVWSIDAGTGIEVTFTFAAGTGFVTPSPGQWFNGSPTIVSGQVNGLSSVANSFKLAQVVVLSGIVAIPSARSALLMRPYTQELALCRRYWQKHIVVVDTPAAYQSWAFPVEFRFNPAVTGGGAGFTVNSPNTQTANFSQTSRAIQTLSLDARL